MILIKQHEQNSWENNQFSSCFGAFEHIKWSSSADGVFPVVMELQMFRFPFFPSALQRTSWKQQRRKISQHLVAIMEISILWFYDNWENSICWWRSCMINRSLTATKKTLWRVFLFFLHYNNSCTSFRGSAPLWILTRDAGWPWRCSWEGGTQPCVSGPASGQSIASLRSSPTPPNHRPAVETDKFGKTWRHSNMSCPPPEMRSPTCDGFYASKMHYQRFFFLCVKLWGYDRVFIDMLQIHLPKWHLGMTYCIDDFPAKWSDKSKKLLVLLHLI